MLISHIPLVQVGDTDPMVGKVRAALNVPGGFELDRPLAEILRGVQRANGIEPTGWLDEATLAVFDIAAF